MYTWTWDMKVEDFQKEILNKNDISELTNLRATAMNRDGKLIPKNRYNFIMAFLMQSTENKYRKKLDIPEDGVWNSTACQFIGIKGIKNQPDTFRSIINELKCMRNKNNNTQYPQMWKTLSIQEAYNEIKNGQCFVNQTQFNAFKNNQKDVDDLMELIFGSQKGGTQTVNSTNSRINNIIEEAIKRYKQVIFTGAPGTGKTFSVRKYVNEQCNGDTSRYKFVQFHPSYDYTDFVEGLRPVELQGQTNPTFVRMDGVFKEFCRHIVEENHNQNPKYGTSDAEKIDNTEYTDYYFIIDEINRADLSKVFGELMFGLEEAYRGPKHSFDTQYKNLKTYRILTGNDVTDGICNDSEIGQAVPITKDVFEKGFYVPENLHIIGTMNDIDRSVDSIDFALRRRFTWIEIKANDVMDSLYNILSSNDPVIGNLIQKIQNMNKIISNPTYKFGLSEAYHIGPAYFKSLDLNNIPASLNNIFDHNISSILREYTRGRNAEDVDNFISVCKAALVN